MCQRLHFESSKHSIHYNRIYSFWIWQRRNLGNHSSFALCMKRDILDTELLIAITARKCSSTALVHVSSSAFLAKNTVALQTNEIHGEFVQKREKRDSFVYSERGVPNVAYRICSTNKAYFCILLYKSFSLCAPSQNFGKFVIFYIMSEQVIHKTYRSK